MGCCCFSASFPLWRLCIYFFLTMKKLAKSTLSLFRRFSRFAGMTCALVAKDSRKRWMISVVLLVNCEWTVDWRLVIRFSKFFFSLSISLTEIRNMFHFFCLCFFSLTDFFCAPLEPKNNNNIKEGFNFFRPQGNIFEPRHTRLYSVVESCTWARKKKIVQNQALAERRSIFKISTTTSTIL